MAISRTSQIDDDGSGTTGTIWNNAWKTELYNQIDGATGIRSTWVVSDQSGAGLTFTGSAHFLTIGQLVFWWMQITFPSNASSANAVFTGLPFVIQQVHAGGMSTFGPTIHVHTPVSTTVGYLLKGTGANWTNQELSGTTVILQGSYFWV